MEHVENIHPDYTWLVALGVMYLGLLILLCGPVGMVYNALRGLVTGLAFCCVFIYFVMTYLPEKYR
jgi:hypothetical protein